MNSKHEHAAIAATLIVVSDRAAAGMRADETAAQLEPVLAERGFALAETVVIADDRATIAAALRAAAAKTPLVLTTGGTGVSARDVTPEATRDVLDLEIPGLAEEMRRRSTESTIHALGSRAVAGAIGPAIVANLPGRPSAAVECFGYIARALPHLIHVRRGPVDDASHTA